MRLLCLNFSELTGGWLTGSGGSSVLRSHFSRSRDRQASLAETASFSLETIMLNTK